MGLQKGLEMDKLSDESKSKAELALKFLLNSQDNDDNSWAFLAFSLNDYAEELKGK